MINNQWDAAGFPKLDLDYSELELLYKHSESLYLHSLEEISADYASSLAQRQGRLNLGIISPSAQVLRALAAHKGPLELPRVREFGEPEADAVSQHIGLLSLGGIQNLTAAIASLLAKHDGPLHLNGIFSLSVETAKALAPHRGPLHLFEVDQISDEVASVLCNHQGTLGIFPLTKMSENARAMLREHRLRSCEEIGLPPSADFNNIAGLFQLFKSHVSNQNELLYYPKICNLDPAPIRIERPNNSIHNEFQQTSPESIDWLINLLPRIDACIDLVFKELPTETPRYLLDIYLRIGDDRLTYLQINTVDGEGFFWEAHGHFANITNEYTIDCWGGNHYQSAGYIAYLPPNHSIHETRLEGLKWWQNRAGII
jgi:hypothetical protein